MMNYMTRSSNSGSLEVNSMIRRDGWNTVGVGGSRARSIVTDGSNDPVPTWRCLH